MLTAEKLGKILITGVIFGVIAEGLAHSFSYVDFYVFISIKNGA